MKKVQDFTDQELEQQIEMLQGMDVMGSQKLLKSFLEEKERREAEREAQEEEERAKREKQAKKDEEQRTAKIAEVLNNINEIYGKCYRIEKDGFIKYYHVRGFVDDDICVDTVYRYSYRNSHASTVVPRRVKIDEFRKELNGAVEVPYAEFVENKKIEFKHDSLTDTIDRMYNFITDFGGGLF